jgi:hypothetical protein
LSAILGFASAISATTARAAGSGFERGWNGRGGSVERLRAISPEPLSRTGSPSATRARSRSRRRDGTGPEVSSRRRRRRLTGARTALRSRAKRPSVGPLDPCARALRTMRTVRYLTGMPREALPPDHSAEPAFCLSAPSRIRTCGLLRWRAARWGYERRRDSTTSPRIPRESHGSGSRLATRRFRPVSQQSSENVRSRRLETLPGARHPRVTMSESEPVAAVCQREEAGG